jgi:hypothetical protein
MRLHWAVVAFLLNYRAQQFFRAAGVSVTSFGVTFSAKKDFKVPEQDSPAHETKQRWGKIR